MSVTFGDIPNRDTRWAPVAAALRERPGEWAKVEFEGTDSSCRSTASHIKKGVLKSFRPAGAFEAKTVNYELWARYVGG